MLKECVNKSNQICCITVLDASSAADLFASSSDSLRMYYSHGLSNDTEAPKQEVTKSTELVSETIKNCVHSSDLSGVVKMRLGGGGQQGTKASSL